MTLTHFFIWPFGVCFRYICFGNSKHIKRKKCGNYSEIAPFPMTCENLKQLKM